VRIAVRCGGTDYLLASVIVRILLAWVSNTVAIYLADLLVEGIRLDSDQWHIIVVGAVFGIVNALVRPIVTILALPVIVLTLGIALFFVNLLMLYLTAWILPSFHIETFGAAVVGTIIVWFVNVVLYAVFGLNRRRG